MGFCFLVMHCTANIPKEILYDYNLSLSARLLFFIILSNLEDCERGLFKSSTIIKLLGVSKNTFLKTRKQLEDNKFIRTHKVICEDGSFGNIKY